jgi:hypothetical protein
MGIESLWVRVHDRRAGHVNVIGNESYICQVISSQRRMMSHLFGSCVWRLSWYYQPVVTQTWAILILHNSNLNQYHSSLTNTLYPLCPSKMRAQKKRWEIKGVIKTLIKPCKAKTVMLYRLWFGTLEVSHFSLGWPRSEKTITLDFPPQ